MVKLNNLYLLLLLILFSCQPKNCNCKIDENVLNENIQVIKEYNKTDNWSKLGLQHHKNFKYDTYRLIIIPSWTNSIVYEYILENHTVKPQILVNQYRRLDKDGEVFFNKMNQTTKINLSNEKWTDFEKLVTDKCFWTTPTESKKRFLDGVSWILEVKKRKVNDCSNQNYHIVTRVDAAPIFFELCDHLLKLANSSKKELDDLLYKNWTSF